MTRRFTNREDHTIWAEFQQLPDLSFVGRNYSDQPWQNANASSWAEIEERAENNFLVDLEKHPKDHVLLHECDCGAKKTQNPNCHSDWCDTVQKRMVSA